MIIKTGRCQFSGMVALNRRRNPNKKTIGIYLHEINTDGQKNME